MGYALNIFILVILLLSNELNCVGIYSFDKKKICFLLPCTSCKFGLNVGGKKFTEEGCVTHSLGGTAFQVETKMDKKILCELSGRLKIRRIRIDIGNMVVVEINSRFPNRGRIVKRLTNRFYKTKTFGAPRQLQNKNNSDSSDSSESEEENYEEEDSDEENYEEFSDAV